DGGLAAALLAPVPLLLLLGAAASPTPVPAASGVSDHAAQIEAWRQRRVARLTAPDGWLAVVGLFWLEDGDNSVGSAPGPRVALPPRTPASVGTIRVASGRATLVPSAEAASAVEVDGKPAAGGP